MKEADYRIRLVLFIWNRIKEMALSPEAEMLLTVFLTEFPSCAEDNTYLQECDMNITRDSLYVLLQWVRLEKTAVKSEWERIGPVGRFFYRDYLHANLSTLNEIEYGARLGLSADALSKERRKDAA